MQTHHRHRRPLTVVLGIGLLIAQADFHPGYGQVRTQKAPHWPSTFRSETIEIDPCSIATPEQLKLLISWKIGETFPQKFSDRGHHITLSNPELTGLECPNLTISVRIDVRYQKTRGFPQFSSKGKLRFRSPLVARVTYLIRSVGKIERAQVTEALACLTDIDVTEYNLRRVPNWLDNAYMRKKLNERLPDQVCFDLTDLVKEFLDNQGGSVQALRALAVSPPEEDDKSTGEVNQEAKAKPSAKSPEVGAKSGLPSPALPP